MRLVVTGGGTGGHVFPALEIASAARERGADVAYYGSLRGQEGAASQRLDFPFTGFPAEPIYSLRTRRGWAGLLMALKSSRKAKAKLKADGIDVVFSTGGYSAAPVMQAARSLGLPFVIYECNSVPGRANRLFASRAVKFCCLFHHTLNVVQGAERTGHPIRKALRDAASERHPGNGLVVVTGGSQGSAFLNRTVPEAAKLVQHPAKWLHATGPLNFEAVKAMTLPSGYEIQPYLEADVLAQAYATASVAVGRSGGTLAEYAVFRLPSVLVPLPTSADDHQLHNAKEFVEMGAATLVTESQATPEALATAISDWLTDDARRATAETVLAAWDLPDATARITDFVMGAAK